MNSFTKGIAIVLAPDDGESLWQPLPSTGYVINKIHALHVALRHFLDRHSGARAGQPHPPPRP